MAIFQRRDAPPADVVAQLPRHERIVSWADVRGGGAVVASPAGLWWPDPDGLRLIDWYRISKAVWNEGALMVVEADVVDDLLLVDRRPAVAELRVPRDLPPVVRKRVEANVLHTDLIQVPGGAARVVARRVPGRDGVHWWARLESGTRDTAVAREAISARVAGLRADQDALHGRL